MCYWIIIGAGRAVGIHILHMSAVPLFRLRAMAAFVRSEELLSTAPKVPEPAPIMLVCA